LAQVAANSTAIRAGLFFAQCTYTSLDMVDRDEEGKWCLLNPLCIRFSQPRINPYFKDGHLLEETWCEIYETPLSKPEGASAAPQYDVVLVPPFPAIRVISWLPKIRRPDGEAERDENGDTRLGQRAWFALDNRRLHCLQRAAARRWPRRCCVALRCVEEVPGNTTSRELRKFRTTTQGKNIEVGMRMGDTRTWCWADDCPPSTRDTLKAEGAELEPDGLFPEDLWDAHRWASHAIDASLVALAEAKERRELEDGPPDHKVVPPSPEETPVPRMAAWAKPPVTVPLDLPPSSPQLATPQQPRSASLPQLASDAAAVEQQLDVLRLAQLSSALRSAQASAQFDTQMQLAQLLMAQRAKEAGAPLHRAGASQQLAALRSLEQQEQQQRQQQRQQQQQQQQQQQRWSAQQQVLPQFPRVISCPFSGWEYMDPAGRIQGPFNLDKMRLWHRHGFFCPELPMRCSAASQFVRFSELWPRGVLPFTSQIIEY